MNALLKMRPTLSEQHSAWQDAVAVRADELAADLVAGKSLWVNGAEWTDRDSHIEAADRDEYDELLPRLAAAQTPDESWQVACDYVDLLNRVRLELARTLAQHVLRAEIAESQEDAVLMAAGL